jgi:hypothetical protein
MIVFIDKSAQTGNDFFNVKGTHLHVEDIDGDTIMYNDRGETKLGTVRKDVFRIQDLPFEGRMQALYNYQGGRYAHPKVGMREGNYTFVWFNNELCVRFFKQGGYIAHYAPISLGQARDLAAGRATLRYIKNSNKYVVR